eukprot:COSAG02_NODE_612_length_19541_cov_13.245150_2_plen_75_part_00
MYVRANVAQPSSMALGTAAGDGAELMDELFGSSSGSEGEDPSDDLPAAAAAAQAGTYRGSAVRRQSIYRRFATG